MIKLLYPAYEVAAVAFLPDNTVERLDGRHIKAGEQIRFSVYGILNNGVRTCLGDWTTPKDATEALKMIFPSGYFVVHRDIADQIMVSLINRMYLIINDVYPIQMGIPVAEPLEDSVWAVASESHSNEYVFCKGTERAVAIMNAQCYFANIYGTDPVDEVVSINMVDVLEDNWTAINVDWQVDMGNIGLGSRVVVLVSATSRINALRKVKEGLPNHGLLNKDYYDMDNSLRVGVYFNPSAITINDVSHSGS